MLVMLVMLAYIQEGFRVKRCRRTEITPFHFQVETYHYIDKSLGEV